MPPPSGERRYCASCRANGSGSLRSRPNQMQPKKCVRIVHVSSTFTSRPRKRARASSNASCTPCRYAPQRVTMRSSLLHRSASSAPTKDAEPGDPAAYASTSSGSSASRST